MGAKHSKVSSDISFNAKNVGAPEEETNIKTVEEKCKVDTIVRIKLIIIQYKHSKNNKSIPVIDLPFFDFSVLMKELTN